VEEREQIVAGAQMLIKSITLRLASVAYVPRGPIGHWLDNKTTSQLFSELHRIALTHRAIFLRIEPPVLDDPVISQILQQNHFRAGPYTMQPRATLIIDLNQDLDDIFEKMPSKTRYNIKYARKNEIKTFVGNREHLPAFYNLMQLTGRRGQFTHRTRDYYEHEWEAFAKNEQVVLLMAQYKDKSLASRMAFSFGNHAATFHSASSGEHRNLRPNYLLAWEAIKWAKARGCQSYDLWGIPDEVGKAACEGKNLPKPDRTDGLWGVYQFKRAFSKNVVFYLNSHDYVYSPLLYFVTTNRFFSGQRLDRIIVWMDKLRPLSAL
jgi:lipid II:glycine glycyltransferase (peptidoglycan interpeptide bridge formation enzyme)